MYESIKEWMTCPIAVKPFVKLNAAADKEFGEPVVIMGYLTGEATVVNDAAGREVVSNTQIYYDPDKYTVGINDRVFVDDLEKDIVTITSYIDGNTGKPSIKVVYL